jgi:hypothetical protein
MMIYYRVFGLTFKADCELPGLEAVQKTLEVDYSLRFHGGANRLETLRGEFHCPWYLSPWRVKSGRKVVQVYTADNCRKFLFRFYDGVEFIIDRGRKDIWVGGLRKASLQAAMHHLLFSLSGFLLGLRKSVCLHGAAIGWGGGAIALLGKPNSGKSLLSASMAVRGMEVLSDDLVALDVIDGIPKVHPGYPWISLRPESLHWLGTDNFNRDRFRSKWHYLDDAYVTWDLRPMGRRSQFEPKKLEAIYLLAPVEESNCKPVIDSVPQTQALMALMEAAGRTHIPYREVRIQDFSLLGSVVPRIPTHELRYHLSSDSLAAVGTILQEHQGLQRAEEQRSKHGASLN